jgi:hypothetical protein
MNTDELNALILRNPSRTPQIISNATIQPALRNDLIVPISLPELTTITFENVTFGQVIYFNRQGRGRAVFKNCKFLGSAYFHDFTDGDIFFDEKVQFGCHFEVKNCTKFGVQFSPNCEVSVDQSPLDPARKKFNVLNVSVDDSSRIYFQMPHYLGHLNLMSSQSNFSYLDLYPDELTIRLFSSSVEFLKFKCPHLRQLQLSRTKIELSEFETETIYSIKKFYVAGTGVILRKEGVEELARAIRRNGNERDFLKLMTFAVKAWLKANIETYREKSKTDGKSLVRAGNIFFGNLRYLLQYYCVIKPTGRFYKWENILGIQMAQIFAFAFVYACLGHFKGICDGGACANRVIDLWRAVYFSGMTSITISYGDFIPVGALKVVALVQGFIGVSLNLLFAFSLSKRYASS